MAPKEEPNVILESIGSSDSSQDVTTKTEQQQSNQKSVAPQGEDAKKLWWIHGRGYDLESFVHRHPGGLEAILLGKGRDCTALVESYHAFSSNHSKILEKYLVVEDSSKGANSDFFYDLLKQRVTAALKAKGIDPVLDRGATLGRTLYYLGIFVATVIACYAHVKGSVFGSFAFAVFGWLMGALGHDAGHFAASHNFPVLNEWGVWAMTLICNPILWQQQHTYGHHSYTNEFSHDPDLHHFHLLIRVHKKIKHESIFQYQRSTVYVVLSYLYVVFGTCVYIPATMIQRGSLYGMVAWHDKHRPTKALGMAVHMSFYIGIVMVVPFFFHQSAWTALGAVSLHLSTLGLLFAFFSQVNHLNEPSLESDLETKQEKDVQPRDPRLLNSWAVAQVETSNNFATDSVLWHVLSNGLNHQIEHHLFPGLNHCHLHHISPVVKEACEEFGITYKSYKSWSEIMGATLEWLDKLSADEKSATPAPASE